MSGNPSTSRTPGAGQRLADRLGLKVVRIEGNDLRIACVHNCGSQDNGHVDKDCGVYNCWSCHKALSAWDLAKVVLGDHAAAKRLMVDVGLWEDFGSTGNGHTSTSPGVNSGSKPLSSSEIIDSVAQAKGTTGDGFRAYGAIVSGGSGVAFPTFRLDGDSAEQVSYFQINAPNDKGKNAKGKPAGVFLPAVSCGNTIKASHPQPGETWIVTEGGKNGACYHTLGYKAVGLNGHHIKKEFLAGFVEAFKDVDVVLTPDGDKESIAAFTKIGKAMLPFGKSVKLASLPYGEIRDKGGADVRDVFKSKGADAIHQAIDQAVPIEGGGEETGNAKSIGVSRGDWVIALDRGNRGTINTITGDTINVHFVNPDTGDQYDRDFQKSELTTLDGKPLESRDEQPRFLECLVTSRQLVDEPADVCYLVDGILTAGEPGTVGGPAKCLKTLTMVDLVVSVASGRPFLDRFEVLRQGPVGFLSGESGRAVLRRAAMRIAQAKGVDLRELPITWGFSLPQLTAQDHVSALADWISKEGLVLVGLDPTYLCLLNAANAGQAGNLFAMGAALAPLSEMVGQTGATMVLLHHYRKNRPDNGGEPADLQDLAMSGMMEWSRFWLLLDRVEPYTNDGQHKLWLRAGGSAGHAGLYGLTVNERAGDRGDGWQVGVEHVGDVRRSIQDAKEGRRAADLERREGEHVERVVQALRQFPDGETARKLSAAARLNSDNFTRAIISLEKQGRVEACQVLKSKVPYAGYKLKN